MPLVICEGKFGTIDAEDSPFCRYYMIKFTSSLYELK